MLSTIAFDLPPGGGSRTWLTSFRLYNSALHLQKRKDFCVHQQVRTHSTRSTEAPEQLKKTHKAHAKDPAAGRDT
jgi:hypothetical protein